MIESQLENGGQPNPKSFPISNGQVYEYWKAKIEEVKEHEKMLERIKREKAIPPPSAIQQFRDDCSAASARKKKEKDYTKQAEMLDGKDAAYSPKNEEEDLQLVRSLTNQVFR